MSLKEVYFLPSRLFLPRVLSINLISKLYFLSMFSMSKQLCALILGRAIIFAEFLLYTDPSLPENTPETEFGIRNISLFVIWNRKRSRFSGISRAGRNWAGYNPGVI